MEEDKDFKWCLKTGKGLRLVESNENLVKVYLRKSKSALNMLDSAIEKDELEWILDTSYFQKLKLHTLVCSSFEKPKNKGLCKSTTLVVDGLCFFDYAKYFSIYALFMKIGIKCEIHNCTISAFKKLFVEEKICSEEFHRDIEESRELRIDALYYEKDIGKEKIIESADRTPDFCLEIDKIKKTMGHRTLKGAV